MSAFGRYARVAGLSRRSQQSGQGREKPSLNVWHDAEQILFVGTDGDAGVGALITGGDSRIADIVVVIAGRAAGDFALSGDPELLADGFVRLLLHRLCLNSGGIMD